MSIPNVTSGQTITSALQNAIIDTVNGITTAAGPHPMRLTCEGRLTLTSGTPIATSGVSAASTIYFTPWMGNRIALFDGTDTWNLYALSSELGLALGTLTANTLYDVFCYSNAGVPTLEVGPAWTDSSTRSTEIVLQDGVHVRSGASTRRYLGTFRTINTTQTADSPGNRLLWNHYNRVARPLRVTDSSGSWTYTTATWRQANGSGSNQAGVVVGVSGAAIHLEVDATRSNTEVATGRSSIGINSTSTPGTNVLQSAGSNPAGGFATSQARYHGYPSVGYTSYSWLEKGSGTGTDTWVGTSGDIVSGLTGFIL